MRRLIPITETWDYGFTKKRPIRYREGMNDFVVFSDVCTMAYKEPVWFYGWGNAVWLRCPLKKFDRATVRRCVDFVHGYGWAWEICIK